MKIGIVGSGSVGAALAKRLGAAGHQTMLSFNKDANELDATARRYGAPTGTPGDAVSFGEVVAIAVPWSMVKLALRQAGPLQGKVLWDCTNAITADYAGLEVGTITSGGEVVSRFAPGSRVVKAIPPSAQLLLSDDPVVDGKPVACLLCGDDGRGQGHGEAVGERASSASGGFRTTRERAVRRACDDGDCTSGTFGLNRGYRLGFALLGENTVAPP